MNRMLPGSNRLPRGSSVADKGGFTETGKKMNVVVGTPVGTGYVNERMAAEARLRNDYARTIPINHVDGSR